jgi:DNA-binding response OmpR family regulator
MRQASSAGARKMPQRILIIEDERAIADSIALNLREEGYEVITAFRGDEGLSHARTRHPDLIILDLMLPGMGGLDVCRAIRATSRVPILVLTARGREVDKVVGLELGADDYITKPFGMLELLARVKALLRRAHAAGEPPAGELRAGDLRIDLDRHQVHIGERQVNLRPKEFDLLRVLVINRGRVLTRDLLLQRVWGEDSYLDRGTLDVHIRWLREKIETDPHRPERVITIRGVGYKYAE